MFTGQNYPALHSYAISNVLPANSTGRQVRKLASKLTATTKNNQPHKGPDKQSGDPNPSNPDNSLSKLEVLHIWAVEHLYIVNNSTALEPDQAAVLQAVFYKLQQHYLNEIGNLANARFPVQRIETIYEYHSYCCESIAGYLVNHQITGMTIKPLLLD